MSVGKKYIVVFYVNVENLHSSDVPEYMETAKRQLELDESIRKKCSIVESLFIPVREPTYIDLLEFDT